MAIQIPNPGTGNGASGDNEFVLWSKVKDNFSDQTNAASKLVGTSVGQIPVIGSNFFEHLNSSAYLSIPDNDLDNIKGMTGLTHVPFAGQAANRPTADTYYIQQFSYLTTGVMWAYGARQKGKIWVRNWGSLSSDENFSAWGYLYTSANTKLDTNGAIAPSSPTIDLYSDHIETNDDGSKMNPEFIRNGVGDYTIKNTTGLRENDGWYIKIPNDKYGNPKVMAEIERLGNGDINIKTYGRKFDFEIAGVVPDLDNPQDIPEGRWVDLRFNDLPVEMPDDTQMEV